MSERVRLVEYDAKWPELFEREAQRISRVLPRAALEHVGSTSVPGLAAKPFIDIVAGIEDEAHLEAAILTLQEVGYSYVPEAEAVVPERRFFRRIDESPGYHLHVVARSASLFSNLPLFRDLLRSSPALAQDYGRLKRELAESHEANVDAYTAAKGPFIEAALAAA
jgi:GrpB-like predicted nucleotidyltransferase (UPF0157 family)